MGGFKLTTWNVEWLVHAFRVDTGAVPAGARQGNHRMPSAEQAKAKLEAIREEISLIDPDILLLTEAIPDPEEMSEFVRAYLPNYVLIDRAGQSKQSYHIRGDQWMWFLTKPEIKEKRRAHLLDNATWCAYTKKIYTKQRARRQHRDGYWWISLPHIDKKSGLVGAHELKSHCHHRHPQVLVIDWEGGRIEFIGVHLKSKFTGDRVPTRQPNEKDKDYYTRADVRRFMAKAVQARQADNRSDGCPPLYRSSFRARAFAGDLPVRGLERRPGQGAARTRIYAARPDRKPARRRVIRPPVPQPRSVRQLGPVPLDRRVQGRAGSQPDALHPAGPHYLHRSAYKAREVSPDRPSEDGQGRA